MNKIENKLKSHQEIISANINFNKLELTLETTRKDNTKEFVSNIIKSINTDVMLLDIKEKTNFTTLINNCSNVTGIRFIIIDNIDGIKTMCFEPWYKNNCDLSEAIWFGNGITNQFTVKVTTASRLLRGDVEPGFAYIIRKGKASLDKLISDEQEG